MVRRLLFAALAGSAVLLPSCTARDAVPASVDENFGRAHSAAFKQPSMRSTADSSSFNVLYRFKGPPNDGGQPVGRLLYESGILYGTASEDSEVFSLTPSGGYTVLHQFSGPPDGNDAHSGLIALNGNFFGTTAEGGTANGPCETNGGCGTVYEITPQGAESVIYRFTGPPDGFYPRSDLVVAKGVFYGTTLEGGSSKSKSCTPYNACGTVFKLTPAGKETVIHSFQGGSDGYAPDSSVIDVKGEFYGTTIYGGRHDDGTVYKISANGSEKILYNFKGAADGCDPYGPLIYVAGVLYGTTNGGPGCRSYGTVFALTLAGKETVLHKFAGGTADGAYPFAGLADVSGILYGTASGGGGVGSNACGVIFSITTGGSESILHSFNCSSDGGEPQAQLIYANSLLYGSTTEFVRGSGDHGTVFSQLP